MLATKPTKNFPNPTSVKEKEKKIQRKQAGRKNK